MSESHTADLATRYRYRLEGAEAERERIRARIQERIDDMIACHKPDTCRFIAQTIAEYLPEWIEPEQSVISINQEN